MPETIFYMKANVLQDFSNLHWCTFKFYIGSDVCYNKDRAQFILVLLFIVIKGKLI